jgi:2'-5' RNA ligase
LFYRVEDGAKKLAALARDLDNALAARLDMAHESRPFRAHVTVARIASALSPQIIDALAAAPPAVGASQRVDLVHLIRSQLSRKGPEYYHLKEFALTKSK